MLTTFRKSIGRSFKRSKVFSKYLDPVTSGKPGNVASSEDDHEEELSALRGVIPRFSASEAGPSNCPTIRGWCPTVHSSVVSRTSRSRTVNRCDKISLSLPPESPGPRTPEPRSDHVPDDGSPTNQAAIQSNSITIAPQSPSRPMDRWVQAQGSAQLSEDENSRSQPLSSRAGNAQSVSQPRQVVQPPTVEGSVPGGSYQRPGSTSNNDVAPAGDLVLGETSSHTSTQNQQPSPESEPPRDQNTADSDGSGTIRAPPPATFSLPIRLKNPATLNEDHGCTGFGGTAPSA